MITANQPALSARFSHTSRTHTHTHTHLKTAMYMLLRGFQHSGWSHKETLIQVMDRKRLLCFLSALHFSSILYFSRDCLFSFHLTCFSFLSSYQIRHSH
ncbi:hypothetical protein DNTS_024375 [Danionella cerebrum]|uniref:Uncharacterized protein n=1 Tax=Danionella cerebrum TaxID=2873325 RepID=A0A553QXL1_9TELE|nr:hypothetical protein DNTS_024375 [Danionella translucida]